MPAPITIIIWIGTITGAAIGISAGIFLIVSMYSFAHYSWTLEKSLHRK